MNGQLFFRPALPTVQRIKRVPVGTGVDVGDVLRVHPPGFQRLSVNLTSSNDEALCFALLTGQVQRVLQTVDHERAGGDVIRVARHNNVGSALERSVLLRNALVVLPARHHDVSLRGLHEKLHVQRQGPHQIVVLADDTIGGHGGDCADFHPQTLTAALMCGLPNPSAATVPENCPKVKQSTSSSCASRVSWADGAKQTRNSASLDGRTMIRRVG